MVHKSLLILFVVVLLLSACTAKAPSQNGFTITDGAGREVTLDKTPERIVVAGRASALIIDAVYAFPQASERVVAMSKTSQTGITFGTLMDPKYAEKAIYPTDVGPEQIAEAKPDLVITKSSNAEKLGGPLDALGIKVVYVDFETPETYRRDLANLGKVFGDDKRAQALVKFYDDKLAEVAKGVKNLKDEDKPRTLLLYYSDKDGEVAFNVPPLNWIQTILVTNAGGNPVWADAQPGSGWTKVSLEQIAAWDADMIFVIAYTKSSSEVVEMLKANAEWAEIRAVKEGKLYGFATDFYSWDQPDTRWILGQLWLATKLHPDLFSKLNIETEAKSFYQELYSIDETAFTNDIRPMFSGDLP